MCRTVNVQTVDDVNIISKTRVCAALCVCVCICCVLVLTSFFFLLFYEKDMTGYELYFC